MPTITSAAAADALVDPPETVVREPRFRGVDWALFGVLSVASTAAIAAFFSYVVQHADRSWSLWIAVAVTGWWLLLWEAKWLALLHMARPRRLPPPPPHVTVMFLLRLVYVGTVTTWQVGSCVRRLA